MGKTKDFNNFRFEGLNYFDYSNKYYGLNRVSETGDKICVNVVDAHLITTQYGYALILDNEHVVFVKNWQVDQNYFGNEVILDRKFFNVKKWGFHEEFSEADKAQLTFDYWKRVAEEQQKYNPCKWKKS